MVIAGVALFWFVFCFSALCSVFLRLSRFFVSLVLLVFFPLCALCVLNLWGGRSFTTHRRHRAHASPSFHFSLLPLLISPRQHRLKGYGFDIMVSSSIVFGVLAYAACSSSLLLLNKMAVMGSGSKTLALLLQFVASIIVVLVMSKVGSKPEPLRFSVKRAVRASLNYSDPFAFPVVR